MSRRKLIVLGASLLAAAAVLIPAGATGLANNLIGAYQMWSPVVSPLDPTIACPPEATTGSSSIDVSTTMPGSYMTGSDATQFVVTWKKGATTLGSTVLTSHNTSTTLSATLSCTTEYTHTTVKFQPTDSSSVPSGPAQSVGVDHYPVEPASA